MHSPYFFFHEDQAQEKKMKQNTHSKSSHPECWQHLALIKYLFNIIVCNHYLITVISIPFPAVMRHFLEFLFSLTTQCENEENVCSDVYLMSIISFYWNVFCFIIFHRHKYVFIKLYLCILLTKYWLGYSLKGFCKMKARCKMY